MRTRLLVIAASVSLAAPAVAAPIAHGPKATTDAVLAAEKQYSDRFAAGTVAQGMREMIDPVDGLAFAGGDPVRGSAATYAAFGGDAAPTTIKLSWVPAEVFAASSGDMAASWGRFTMTDTTAKQPPFTGRYVTVWRKTASGAWKAIMDIGEPDAPPPPPPPPR
jgi:ketosteroid isomerase-like protein